MISSQKALEIVLSTTPEREIEEKHINKCVGSILAENIYAKRNQPPFNRVAMDGIAIHYNSQESILDSYTIEGVQAAGSPQLELKDQKGCIEVMTGAMLPAGCNTVIPYERTTIENGKASINLDSIEEWQNIHKMGSDYKKDELLIKKHTKITAPVKAVIASQGSSKVSVFKTPAIAIVSTGSELVEQDSPVEDYQIYMSNNHAIDHELKAYGLNDNHLIHISDSKDETEKILKSCLEKYDIIILTGGVSKGKFDFVPDALLKLEVEKHFHKIKQKPGKPMWYGTYKNKQVYGLPGNPVSCLINLNRYVLPALNKSCGATSKSYYATLDEDVTFKKDFTLFKPVTIQSDRSGHLIATPVKSNGSGDFYSLSLSDGYLELPAESSTFDKGTTYKFFPWN